MIHQVKGLAQPAGKAYAKARESKILKEFREFAVRGSVMDLAIGIMIGGAFNKIVTSLVNDIIMPPLGLLIGKMNFANLFLNLSDQEFRTVEEAKAAGAATINYGLFLNAVIDFILIAIITFFIVRQINRWKQHDQGPPPVPTTRQCPYCFSQIHDRATRCGSCTSALSAA